MNSKLLIIPLLAMASLTAAAQQLTASEPIVDLGQIIFKQPASAEFTLENASDSPLTISKVRSSCGCTTTEYPANTIAAGSKFTLKATYDAKQMGHFQKQIGIYVAGQEEPLMLSVRGVVVDEKVDFAGDYPYQLGNLLTDINNLEFDDVNRGDRPYLKFHIMNNGTVTAQPVIMHLPNYLKAEISPSKIAPGHSGVATVMLDSRLLRSLGLTQTSVYLGSFLGDKVSPDKEISVSTVLLPDFDRLTDTQRLNAPHIQLSDTALNLDSFNGKSKAKSIIRITNTGKSLLEIRSLQMFTTGLEVSLNKTRILPGEVAKLKITAMERQLKQARSKPRVLMITNDPDNSKITIDINVR